METKGQNQPTARGVNEEGMMRFSSSADVPGSQVIYPNGSDELTLTEIILKIRNWLRYLYSNWLVLLLTISIGALLGLTYAWLKRPTYTATTTFVLENGGGEGMGGLGQYAGIASMVGIDLGGDGGGIFQGDNIIELYKSRTMIEKALLSQVIENGKKQLIIDRYIDFNNLRKGWQKTPQLAKIQFTQPGSLSRIQDSIIGETVKQINSKYLSVSKPDKKLSIIEVKVEAKDEIFAKVFNEQIVQTVNDFYVETKTKKAIENVAILQQKTDSVRAVMNGAIYSAAVTADATPNLNPTRQVKRAAPMQRSQFTAETNKAILAELVKNLEMSKISLRKETPLIQVVDKPVYPLEKESFGKLKGIILGAFLAGFLTVMVLSIKLFFKRLVL